MADYEFEAEMDPNDSNGRQGLEGVTEARSFIAQSPNGVIYVSRTQWIDERPKIRWVSLDHGHIDGQPESLILQTINLKFAEQVAESIADNDTGPLK